MSTAAPGRRLLLVHAHPDDESINNGATMAGYAAEGAHVTLVTCTLGEEGEVIPPELAHLAPDPKRRPDTPVPTGPSGLTPLAEHRRGELDAAMRALGVTDHRLLGGPGRHRDSGMMGSPLNDDAGCFWQAPVDEAAAPLAGVIRELRPQVLVTYDPNGGYGHPDHIQAHRVAMRAVELAADPGADGTSGVFGDPHTVARVYWNCVPRSALADGFARLHAAEPGTYPYLGIAEPADVPGLLDDGDDGGAAPVDAVIDARKHAGAKADAMRAHATQITVDDAGETFALSNGLGQPLSAVEHYRLATGWEGANGGETVRDLFEGTGV